MPKTPCVGLVSLGAQFGRTRGCKGPMTLRPLTKKLLLRSSANFSGVHGDVGDKTIMSSAGVDSPVASVQNLSKPPGDPDQSRKAAFRDTADDAGPIEDCCLRTFGRPMSSHKCLGVPRWEPACESLRSDAS